MGRQAASLRPQLQPQRTLKIFRSSAVVMDARANSPPARLTALLPWNWLCVRVAVHFSMASPPPA